MHWQTHTVFNQPTPLNNSNLFLSDTALREAVVREGAGWDGDLLASIGQQLGTAESLELGRLANSNPPELLRYDATGARLDDVRFHPAWHLLMQGLCANRVHNLAWQEDAREGAFVARAARFLLHAQVEAGTLCPITMTFAATPLLQHALPRAFWRLAVAAAERPLRSPPCAGRPEARSADWHGDDREARGLRCAEQYHPRGENSGRVLPAGGTQMVFLGAAERCAPGAGPGACGSVVLLCAAPAARRAAQRGASGALKEKLGNRSNASSEVEFYDACGWLVGDEGDGVRQILRMGGLTRFDCALGSHALMRRAFSVALYHALQRQAFGKNLVDQPMMRQLLGQMALRLEGQTAFLFRLARAWDRRDDARESAWARLFTPAAKFAICKAGIPFVAEAMEVLGGIGYCEESELPRLYREMPVNSIWEGSGNIMCLDVMRVLSKQPAAMELLAAECAEVKGQNRHLDRAWRQLQQLLKRPAEEQGREIARLVYRLGAGAQMLRFASPPLAEAWCRMMLDTRGGIRLDAPTLDDLLLRAMGRGRQAPQA